MQEHKYKHRHSHKKDGIDTFREQSLKAIQRKKLYAKVAYIVVFTIAIIMIALAFAAYFIDRYACVFLPEPRRRTLKVLI